MGHGNSYVISVICLSCTVLLHQKLQDGICELNSYFGSNNALNQDDTRAIGLGMCSYFPSPLDLKISNVIAL